VPEPPAGGSTPIPPDPLYLATAIEAVLEAGRIQLASFGKDGLRIDKKGAIDLVSQFGSTSCKSLYQCKDCLEPFDYFKAH